ncbi:MAG TPA: TolC family protein, partial [Phycisphaeraceae bacterium]
LLGLSSLAACAVDQQAEVATYRRVLDGDEAVAVEPYHPEQPLSLEDALRLANAHNEQLAIRGEDYLQALIAKDRAAARFVPVISFAPSFTVQDNTNLGGDSELIHEFVREQSLDLPLEADLEVNPVREVASVRLAQATAQAQRALLLDLRADVLLDVAATYYQTLRSQQQVQVLTHSLEVQQRRLADVQARREAGTALPLDVAQVRAQVAQTRATLIQARRDVRNGRATLAFLIGAPEVAGELTDELTVPERLPSDETLLAVAQDHRQDLAAAQARIEAAAENLQRAWGQYFPSVSLELDYFLSRQSFPPDVDWLGVVELRVPIFSAGLIHADVRDAWSELRQARLNRSRIERQVLEQLRVALEDLQSSRQRIEQLQTQVEAAQEALDRTEQAYEAGLMTNLDRLIAQDQLLSAQLDWTGEQLDYKLNYLTLLRILGRLDVDLAAASAPLWSTAAAPTAAMPAADR